VIFLFKKWVGKKKKERRKNPKPGFCMYSIVVL